MYVPKERHAHEDLGQNPRYRRHKQICDRLARDELTIAPGSTWDLLWSKRRQSVPSKEDVDRELLAFSRGIATGFWTPRSARPSFL